MGLLIQIGVVVFLLVLGWAAGRAAERRHRKRMARREAALVGMVVTQVKNFPGGADPAAHGDLVVAEVVIANDYFKSFAAAIRKLLGGELHSYHSLLERARREAVLRIREKANAKGHNAVCNVRLETAAIGAMSKKGPAMVGVIASGTAYRLPASPST